MWITVHGKNSTEIDDDVVRRILNIYPEEYLENRDIFQEAFTKGSISINDLKSESEKILIPWQMFFLTQANFNAQMKHIDAQRHHKLSPKIVAKRKGAGDVTSKRIIDRLIRQQNFLTSLSTFPKNTFCGSLKGVSMNAAVQTILSHFDIDREVIWRYTSKGKALQYLIGQVESKNINVSRGVLTNKLLPTYKVVSSDVYRGTSGFVIRDDYVPFIFLPSEINPDEVESRQIYTLIYLLAIIGLEQYGYFLDKDFKAKMLSATGVSKKLHDITTEFLIPKQATEYLRGLNITEEMRDTLAYKFKVSPSALIVTLRMRGIISNPVYESLKPPQQPPLKKKSQMRPPKISTSVEKFCGQISYRSINTAIQNRVLPAIQAQYLIFGAVNKKGYKKYRNELGI